VIKPDAFYLVAERRDLFFSGSECVPDLIVEVLAAETARRDRREKLSLYAEVGVHEYWLIDPELSILEVLANDHGRLVVTLPAGGRYPSPGLAGLVLDLAELWREIASHSPVP
jgi:Uma2 family endonuclease